MNDLLYSDILLVGCGTPRERRHDRQVVVTPLTTTYTERAHHLRY